MLSKENQIRLEVWTATYDKVVLRIKELDAEGQEASDDFDYSAASGIASGICALEGLKKEIMTEISKLTNESQNP